MIDEVERSAVRPRRFVSRTWLLAVANARLALNEIENRWIADIDPCRLGCFVQLFEAAGDGNVFVAAFGLDGELEFTKY